MRIFKSIQNLWRRECSSVSGLSPGRVHMKEGELRLKALRTQFGIKKRVEISL